MSNDTRNLSVRPCRYAVDMKRKTNKYEIEEGFIVNKGFSRQPLDDIEYFCGKM